VLAIIQAELSDKDLVALREQENRSRADVSLYERGLLYQRALDEATFDSERKLAEELAVPRATLQRCLHAARLAPAVLRCFENPCMLQARGVDQLHSAYESDPDALLRRAEAIQAKGQRLSYTDTIKALLGQTDQEPNSVALEVKGRKLGTLSTSTSGAMNVALLPKSIPSERREAFVRDLEALLSRYAPKP
jgi:ParB family chromosome partitioning protein